MSLQPWTDRRLFLFGIPYFEALIVVNIVLSSILIIHIRKFSSNALLNEVFFGVKLTEILRKHRTSSSLVKYELIVLFLERLFTVLLLNMHITGTIWKKVKKSLIQYIRFWYSGSMCVRTYVHLIILLLLLLLLLF